MKTVAKTESDEDEEEGKKDSAIKGSITDEIASEIFDKLTKLQGKKTYYAKKKTGQMTKPTFFSGRSKSTAEGRASLHRNSTRMTGSRSLGSSQEEMILSASTSSTKTRSQPYKRVTGSKEKTRSS